MNSLRTVVCILSAESTGKVIDAQHIAYVNRLML